MTQLGEGSDASRSMTKEKRRRGALAKLREAQPGSENIKGGVVFAVVRDVRLRRNKE